MFSQTVEYALRAMVCLADGDGAAQTSLVLSEKTQVPQAYLSKIMNQLVDAGLVRSQRGVNGGFSLTESPATTSILTIVNAIEPVQRIHTCPLGISKHGKDLCPLHRRMDNAMCGVEQALGQSTLAEILAEPTKSRPLCDAQHA